MNNYDIFAYKYRQDSVQHRRQLPTRAFSIVMMYVNGQIIYQRACPTNEVVNKKYWQQII